MSTVLTLDLTEATATDPAQYITKLNSDKVKFESNESDGYSEVMFRQINIPETATFLKFDVKTRFKGGDPKLGNVNVGIQPSGGENSFFRTVQGIFKGTLALDLSSVSGEVPWLGIGFPGGAFGIGEFIATVGNLRFVDDATVPDEELMDVL